MFKEDRCQCLQGRSTDAQDAANAAQDKPGFHEFADALAAAVQFPPGRGMLPVLHHAWLKLQSASVQAA